MNPSYIKIEILGISYEFVTRGHKGLKIIKTCDLFCIKSSTIIIDQNPYKVPLCIGTVFYEKAELFLLNFYLYSFTG